MHYIKKGNKMDWMEVDMNVSLHCKKGADFMQTKWLEKPQTLL